MKSDYDTKMLKIFRSVERSDPPKPPVIKPAQKSSLLPSVDESAIVESVITESKNSETINVDELPGINKEDPNYEMRKDLLTKILKRNPALFSRMKNWD